MIPWTEVNAVCIEAHEFSTYLVLRFRNVNDVLNHFGHPARHVFATHPKRRRLHVLAHQVDNRRLVQDKLSISMASNAVRSSQAIFMMREMSDSVIQSRPGCAQNQAARIAVADRLWGTTHQRYHARDGTQTCYRGPQSVQG